MWSCIVLIEKNHLLQDLYWGKKLLKQLSDTCAANLSFKLPPIYKTQFLKHPLS